MQSTVEQRVQSTTQLVFAIQRVVVLPSVFFTDAVTTRWPSHTHEQLQCHYHFPQCSRAVLHWLSALHLLNVKAVMQSDSVIELPNVTL